jgi:hypothetical protein
MESETQGLCGAIIDFLVHALRYQKKWGIGEPKSFYLCIMTSL